MILTGRRRLVGKALIGIFFSSFSLLDGFLAASGSPAYRSHNVALLFGHGPIRPSQPSRPYRALMGMSLSGPFTGNEPHAERCTMDRKQALSHSWSSVVAALTTTGVVATGAARPARAGFTDFIFPSQDESVTMPIDVGDFDKEITFEDFTRSLLKGEVKKCEFFGSNFDKAVLQLADGSKALIGEGYPQERAFSDDSPMKVVGMLRNAGVPFTTPFKTSTYNKPQSFKTTGTLEAENRQQREDATLDRLMAE